MTFTDKAVTEVANALADSLSSARRLVVIDPEGFVEREWDVEVVRARVSPAGVVQLHLLPSEFKFVTGTRPYDHVALVDAWGDEVWALPADKRIMANCDVTIRFDDPFEVEVVAGL